jgi:hypothetical protein
MLCSPILVRQFNRNITHNISIICKCMYELIFSLQRWNSYIKSLLLSPLLWMKMCNHLKRWSPLTQDKSKNVLTWKCTCINLFIYNLKALFSGKKYTFWINFFFKNNQIIPNLNLTSVFEINVNTFPRSLWVLRMVGNGLGRSTRAYNLPYIGSGHAGLFV